MLIWNEKSDTYTVESSYSHVMYMAVNESREIQIVYGEHSSSESAQSNVEDLYMLLYTSCVPTLYIVSCVTVYFADSLPCRLCKTCEQFVVKSSRVER